MSDEAPPAGMPVEYLGGRVALFWLALKTLGLSLVTLGIYRFWMKARLRRYYWSATEIEGEPLEYVGTGLEKFLGFLIAVTFLAVYLGIAQVALSFIGIAVIEGNTFAFNLAILAVVPIYFYAIYRARAYVLARTRWRGIRFALKRGAWGYSIRSIWYVVLTAVSAGLLYPRQVFLQERYLVERTRFGDMGLRQEGRWFMLLWPWILFWVPGVALAGAVFWIGREAWGIPVEEMEVAGVLKGDQVYWLLIPAVLLGFLVFALLGTFRAIAVKRMAKHKRAGEGVRLASGIKKRTVFRIQFLGMILSVLVAFIPLILLTLLMAASFQFESPEAGVTWGELLFDPDRVTEGQVIFGAVFSLVIYMLLMFTMSVAWHLFVTQPTWRHFATTLRVVDNGEFAGAKQRHRDEATQAEGFADALDLGAAI